MCDLLSGSEVTQYGERIVVLFQAEPNAFAFSVERIRYKQGVFHYKLTVVNVETATIHLIAPTQKHFRNYSRICSQIEHPHRIAAVHGGVATLEGDIHDAIFPAAAYIRGSNVKHPVHFFCRREQ